MEWIYEDGGRSKYFKTEHVGDYPALMLSMRNIIDDKTAGCSGEEQNRGTSSCPKW